MQAGRGGALNALGRQRHAHLLRKVSLIRSKIGMPSE
jgi:hypothetical protein